MSFQVFPRRGCDTGSVYGRARVHIGGISITKEARSYFHGELVLLWIDEAAMTVGIDPDVAAERESEAWPVKKTKFTHQIKARAFVLKLREMGVLTTSPSCSVPLGWNKSHGFLELDLRKILRIPKTARTEPTIASPEVAAEAHKEE